MNDMWGNPTTFGYSNNYNHYLPHYELIKVKGEQSASQFRMGPNSDALLLDENEPLLYHVQTDGTGFLSVMTYDLVPHVKAPQIDVNQLAQRVAQLEETLNARQSNSKQQKKPQQHGSAIVSVSTTTNTGD